MSGYRMVLLSNHVREWIEFCEEKYKYHQFFDAIFYSFAFGIAKPDKDFFNIALNKLHVNPGACLFVDDYKKNIATAATLHMKTVLFTMEEKLEEEIRSFEVK